MALDPLLSLTVTVCVGRLCLSMLPPGWPGDHNRQELGATLAASWLLGRAAWGLLSWPWLWIPVALLRLALLPGGMRPRHERDREGRPGWLLVFLLCCGASWVGGHLADLATAACGALFALWGWRTWNRRADKRARALAILGFAVPVLVLLLGP